MGVNELVLNELVLRYDRQKVRMKVFLDLFARQERPEDIVKSIARHLNSIG